MLLSKSRILLVLSDSDLAETVQGILESNGATSITSVHCTNQAIEAMVDGCFNMFIVDARVPVSLNRNAVLYGGIDYIRFVRMCEGRLSESTVVFLRTSLQLVDTLEAQEEIQEARSAGASIIMTLPFTDEKFKEEVLPIHQTPRTFIRARSYTGPDRRVKSIIVPRERRQAQKA